MQENADLQWTTITGCDTGKGRDSHAALMLYLALVNESMTLALVLHPV